MHDIILQLFEDNLLRIQPIKYSFGINKSHQTLLTCYINAV